jgi:hypothetical protein
VRSCSFPSARFIFFDEEAKLSAKGIFFSMLQDTVSVKDFSLFLKGASFSAVRVSLSVEEVTFSPEDAVFSPK